MGMTMATSTCSNPNCTCSPCLCGDDCRCNGAAKLGQLEQQVMEIVWRSGDREVTAREVADALPCYAYTTIATILNRLSRKGALRRRSEHNTNMFAAIASRADRAAASMRETFRTSGDPQGALQSFAKTLTVGETTALRTALDEASSKPRTGTSRP